MNPSDSISLLQKFFPDLTSRQTEQLLEWERLFRVKNILINLVSRKDIENLVAHHFLHSLSYKHFFHPSGGSTLLDVGSGGGLPGIALAILYPNLSVTLIDSIKKKAKVMDFFIHSLALSNAQVICTRAEHFRGSFDYITARAVTQIPTLLQWTKHLLAKNTSAPQSGYWLLKGSNYTQEIKHLSLPPESRFFPLYEYLPLEYYREKGILYIPHTIIKM